MRRNWKTGLVTIVTAASLLTGCASGGGTSKETKGTRSSEAGSSETVELTFYNADGQEDPWTDPVAKALTEKTGVKLKTDYPVGEDEQKISLMIAGNEYPDMIYAKGDAQSLIDAGALIDMTDLIVEYGPNIKKLYGDEFDKLKYSKDDPSIYQLSSYAKGGTTFGVGGSAQVQWQVLKENDYKIPESLDEYEQMISNFIREHPKTEDGLDYIGFSISASDWHWMITLGNPAGTIADGEADNGQWRVDDDLNVEYKFKSEREKEYFRWLNKLYNEGLLDPECATQTHEDYIAKISSGRVLGLFDAEWDYREAVTVLLADGKMDQTYAPLPLTMDSTVKCPELTYRGLITGYGVGITTACKNPEAAIKFLDYICSDEGQVLVHWGIEGENYTVENGMRTRSAEEIEKSQTDQNYAKTTGVGFHNYPFPTYGDGEQDANGDYYTTTTKESVINEYNEEQKAACEAWGVEMLKDIFPQADEFPVADFPPVWAFTLPQEVTDIQNVVDEYAQAQLIACVIGKRADFDKTYDAMLKKFEDMDISSAEKMISDIIKEKVAAIKG